MDIPFQIVIFSLLLFLIEIYSEVHLKNYGTFPERIVYLFSIKTIFNLVKFSLLTSFFFIVFHLADNRSLSHFVENYIFKQSWKDTHYYLSVPIIFSIVSIFSNSKELFRQLQAYFIDSEKVNQFVANLKYIIFRLVSFALTLTLFKYILEYTIKFDHYLNSQRLYALDWLHVDTTYVDNYNKGVYISLIITIIIFFLFNNSFIKKNSDYWRFREISFNFFKYFFITIILCLGLFFGLFSIFNGFYNLTNSGLTSWLSKENVLGIFPIRISSILILIYLLGYIYEHVLNRRLRPFLLLGIFPFRHVTGYHHDISFNKRETLFFAQIAFYILNVALAELFIIIGYKSVYLGILNFAILFILDDFKIITDYSKGLSRVMPLHFWRIWLFNLIMLIASIVLLANKDYYLILVVYVIFVLILGRYYLKNSSLIFLRNPI